MEEKYTVTIFWSNDDQFYFAKVEELEGCSAFGETRDEALKEINIAMDLWLEVAREHGDEIPLPKTKAILVLLCLSSLVGSSTWFLVVITVRRITRYQLF